MLAEGATFLRTTRSKGGRFEEPPLLCGGWEKGCEDSEGAGVHVIMRGFPLTSPGALELLCLPLPHVPLRSFRAAVASCSPLYLPRGSQPSAQLWPRLALSAPSERSAGTTVPWDPFLLLSPRVRELLVSFWVIASLPCNLPLRIFPLRSLRENAVTSHPVLSSQPSWGKGDPRGTGRASPPTPQVQE